jgi:hypothetical protein
MKKNISKEIRSALKGSNREAMIDQGGYDGRFRTRKVEDKKRKQSRRECRDFKYGWA